MCVVEFPNLGRLLVHVILIIARNHDISTFPSLLCDDAEDGSYLCSFISNDEGSFHIEAYQVIPGGLLGDYFDDTFLSGAVHVERIELTRCLTLHGLMISLHPMLTSLCLFDGKDLSSLTLLKCIPSQ